MTTIGECAMSHRAGRRKGAFRAAPAQGAQELRTLILHPGESGDFAWVPAYTGGNDPRPPEWSPSERAVQLAVAALMGPALLAGLLLGILAFDRLTGMLPPLPWW